MPAHKTSTKASPSLCGKEASLVKLSTPLSTLMAFMASGVILSRTLKPVQGGTLRPFRPARRSADRPRCRKPEFQKTVDNPAWDAIIGASAPNHYLPLPIIFVPSSESASQKDYGFMTQTSNVSKTGAPDSMLAHYLVEIEKLLVRV